MGIAAFAEGNIDNDKDDNCGKASTTQFFCAPRGDKLTVLH
jgi:hypothetical protein